MNALPRWGEVGLARPLDGFHLTRGLAAVGGEFGDAWPMRLKKIDKPHSCRETVMWGPRPAERNRLERTIEAKGFAPKNRGRWHSSEFADALSCLWARRVRRGGPRELRSAGF